MTAEMRPGPAEQEERNQNMRTWETLREQHPCMSGRAGETGRLHLPVSPECNIRCRYCRRIYTRTEERPGTCLRVLPVAEVPEIVERALALCPQITTVGIAGPGESLASPHALEAFRILDRVHPELIKCLSTNGLRLPEAAGELAEIHLDALTVTVNAVDPAVEAKINDGIFYEGKNVTGEEAAEILIRRQLEGIRKAADLGIAVKINTVLIPGINDTHIGEVAARTAEAGASMSNIIPLIPQADMADIPAPECRETEAARAAAGRSLAVFRHCRHCRADAVGVLGKEDFGRKLYGEHEPWEETFSHG